MTAARRTKGRAKASGASRSRKKFFVHPKGMCDAKTVGEGTRIWAFAHVMAGASIGNHCNVGEQCFVEDGATVGNGCTIKNGVSVWRGVTLGDEVFVGPAAVFTNDYTPRAFVKKGPEALLPTVVERGATIGANATIVCGIRIGEYAFVAAGAVVTRDVPPYALVMGNPARVVGTVCRCGKKQSGDTVCPSCGERRRKAS